jgi:tetratricopeptide (TPR) repeat protein
VFHSFYYGLKETAMRAAVISMLLAIVAQAQTFDTLARQADAARDADRVEQAIGLYRRALRLKPAWADGWWSLGTLLYDADRHADCADAFTRFVALKPDVGPAHALLGLCEFGRRDYDAALRHLLRARELGFAGNEPIREVALYHTALALILKSNFERAIEQLAALPPAGHSAAAVRNAAGLAALRMPLLPDQVPERDRDLVNRMGEAIEAEFDRRQDDAARLLESILAQYPKAPEVRYTYGSLLLQSDPARGLAMLKSELEISPDHVPALAAIAYEYLKENDAASALPYARSAARLAPGDFAARIACGRALLETGSLNQAIEELEAAVRLAPDSPDAHYALANAYARAGRAENAERERKEFARLRKLVDSGRN